jgi:hypothetical protein
VLDEDAAQLLDHAEQRFACLFDQDAAQQYAQQAHITAKREIFGGIGGTGGQFVETPTLVTSIPKRGLTHIQS